VQVLTGVNWFPSNCSHVINQWYNSMHSIPAWQGLGHGYLHRVDRLVHSRSSQLLGKELTNLLIF